MVQVLTFEQSWDLLEVKHTLDDCLGSDVLESSWSLGHGRTAVGSGGGVVLGVSAFGQASAP